MPSLWEIFWTLAEFLPKVFILYLILCLIDKSGLLSLFAKMFHLPVQDLLPVCLSFNCTTMGVCALRDNPQRNRLVYFLSFIPCTAQLPLIFLLFEILGFSFWLIIIWYFVAVIIGLTVLSLLTKAKTCDVIYEPIKIHMPNLWDSLSESLIQTLKFSKKIFIAFVISAFFIVILARLSFNFKIVNDPQESMLFAICSVLSPVFIPIGLDHPAIICALLFGIIAKESAVSVMLFFPDVISNLSLAVLLSLITFYTLYPKCISAQAAISSNCCQKTSFNVLLINLLVAYVLAFVVYTICGILT